MCKRARPRQPPPPQPGALPRLHANAAGTEVGATSHGVAVLADRDADPVRECGPFTNALDRLAVWLNGCGIETVALESTGVDWLPLFRVLEERGFAVTLVDAHRLQRVPGRKSDVLDCQGLQQVHTVGLLAGAVRPDDQRCVVRRSRRQRALLVTDAGQHVQHLQQALVPLHLQLQVVGPGGRHRGDRPDDRPQRRYLTCLRRATRPRNSQQRLAASSDVI